ncbi:MAG: MFS transporter [Singulisphaera sp.]|nr:MFS transporter [Singulisphaera sp.]
MSLSPRVRLSIMMLLQYFVWGTWLPMIAQRIGGPGSLDLTPRQQGWIFTVYGFGAILGPMMFGQLADRRFATEKILAFCHLIGAALLIGAAHATSFWPLFLSLFIYCNLYMASMGLTNSITFRNVGEASFAGIRLWGTIGWVAAGNLYALYLSSKGVPALRPLFDLVGEPSSRDCLRVAGFVSLLYGLSCFALPHTPPIPAKETDPIDKRSAVLESLELMRNRSFAVLVTVAGLLGIMLAFYFACENFFLQDIGTTRELVGSYMTIGQVAEVVVMALVPAAVARFGYKWTMILGASAWALRFGLSIIGQPWWLMIATIGLHGFCFGFFFVVAQMFVDRSAGADIKASAQNLLVFLIYGLGTILGSLLTGEVRSHFGNDWPKIWAGPFVLTVLCILIFAALFHEQEIRKPVLEADTALV